ncbi:hypothetical protein [Janthinobacterium sp. LB3P118]|uniref:hypothetical protein n=1 Tax=Janthinobacterium sp. LB3P118 TaxID=3424195 RepID=UPI003F218274
MGFEFRITASLTQEQRLHIAQLPELAAPAPQPPGSAMPDTEARLTDTGLYVCQHLRPDPWHSLAVLRAWLEAQGVRYTVEEVDD